MATPIGFFPGATPDAYRAMGNEAAAQRLEYALYGPPSAYVPGSNAAASGASALSGGVQLIPGAAGYDEARALPILQEEIAPYDPAVRAYLQSIGQYNETAQAAVERVAREDALREATRQAVVSGQISQGEAQNIVTGITPPPPNIQTQANNIASNTIANVTSGLTNVNLPGTGSVGTYGTTPTSTTPGSYYQQGITAPLEAGEGESMIDPTISPYLGEALARSRYLFLTGPGPELYPEKMYVSPSKQTLDALKAAQMLGESTTAANLGADVLGAYAGGLSTLSNLASPDYMQSKQYEDYLESVTRPVTEAVTEQILPAITSQYSAAGRYGSGAMAQATGTATEKGARAVGDITSQIAQRERENQLSALGYMPSFLGGLSGVVGGALAPSGILAGVGAQREAIAAQPLQEKIQRFEYAQNLPFNMLQGYLGSIYGSPLANRTASPQLQGNTDLQNIGAFLNLAGSVPGAVQGVQTGYNFLRNLF